MYVEEREEREEGEVRGAQEGMRSVCEEGRAEEDHGEVEEGRGDGGQDGGQKRGL